MGRQYRIDELIHYGVKGQKWGVRRYESKDGRLTPAGKERYRKQNGEYKSVGEYDQDRERHEKEVAARRGVKYVRKTKKEREVEDAEEERKDKERRGKEDAAYKRTEDKMKEIDKKLQSKHDLNSEKGLDDYYKEYDEEWFKILREERKKEGLEHFDLSDEELYHYGIKGQKWGRRQYQNKDGSLTPAGRERYGSKENFEQQYPAQQKAAMKAVKGASDEAVKTAKAGKEYEAERTRKKQRKADKAVEEAVRERARNMSDQELREAVNRLNMEENYTRMMQNRERIDVGESAVTKILDGTMKGMTMASTALAIALAIKELKK